MNNLPSSQSWLESIQDYTSRAVGPCIGWFPCLQRQRQIHPETGGLIDSKFISLSPDRRIRVIHIECNSKYVRNVKASEVSGIAYTHEPSLYPVGTVSPQLERFKIQSRSHSVISNSSEPSSEDYWFTRWSRPLRMIEPCNCSFRKSWTKSLRDSKFSNHVLPQTQEEIIHTNPNEDPVLLETDVVDNISPLKEKSCNVIESFVEVLIQEILYDTIKNLSEGRKTGTRINNTENKCFQSIGPKPINASPPHNHKSMVTKIIPSNEEYLMKDLDASSVGDRMECINPNIVCPVIDLSAVEDSNAYGFMPNMDLGCVNPNFMGSLSDPDVIECSFSNGPGAVYENSSIEHINTNVTENITEGNPFSEMNSELESVNQKMSKSDSVSPHTYNFSTLHNIDKQAFHTGNCDIYESNNKYNDDSNTAPGAADMSCTEFQKTDTNIKNSEPSPNMSSIIESNTVQEIYDSVPGPMFENVNLRKKNNLCHHTSNLIRLKPVLLFLHGIGCSADVWSNLLQYFAKEDYEVIAPDMLGHGYSFTPDHAAAYTFHHLLKDAFDIFDKFVGEQKKCVIIGHAYGCSLAAAMARYRPLQVSQLVLISGGGPTPLAPRTPDCRPPSVSPCLQVFMKPLLLCGFRRDILYAPCGKHIGSGDALSSGVPSYVLNHIARGQDWPEGDSAFHRRIVVPTLLVHGMQDPYITLVQECEMERTIPRSFLELISNAGHFAMLETPTKLSHMIHCFIEWWSR